MKKFNELTEARRKGFGSTAIVPSSFPNRNARKAALKKK